VRPVEHLRSRLKRKELELGDYNDHRYGFLLTNVRLLVPVKARGQQRLWSWLPKPGQLNYIDRPIGEGEQRDLL